MDWRGVFLALPLAVFVTACDVSSSSQTDGETWNEGVEYCHDGKETNALEVLRQLMSSKAYGARAAKVATKIEYERGNREEAADAAQTALRADSGDAQSVHNFTLATDGLHEFREKKHEQEVLEKSKDTDPGAQLQSATHEARELMKVQTALATNPPAQAVTMSDDFAKRARTLADVWIPLRQAIAQSVTNEAQAATIQARIDDAQGKTKESAVAFEDMDESKAYSALAYAEQDLTQFLKLTIMPPPAMEEDERAQTNAWLGAEQINGRSWQQDALDFTRAFTNRFPAWAQAYEQQAQSDTNKPPFTAEDQAKVVALATELEALQRECDETSRQEKQAKALDIIRQIRELLPKDKSGGGQCQQNQNQNQQQNNQDNKDQQQQQNQDQQNQSDQTQDQDPQQQEEEKEGEAQESEEKPEDEAVEAVLKKAQERNDEHEAEKKARMRKAPLPPNARDW